MPAPIAGNVRLPLDTGNTGKYKRTQTRLVGADSVHSDYVVVEDPRSVLGAYRASIPIIAVPIAAHTGNTTGFLFLYNPVGSTPKMQIAQLEWKTQFRALAVDTLAGDLRVSRFTFTGVNSGTLVTPSKRDSMDPTSVGQVSTTWATAVITLGAVLTSSFLQTMDLVTGGAGHWNPQDGGLTTANEHEETILRAGEGLVFWNASGVTTANRGIASNVTWDEFE